MEQRLESTRFSHTHLILFSAGEGVHATAKSGVGAIVPGGEASDLDDLLLDRVLDQVAAIVDVEFLHQAGAMRLHRFDR